MDTKINFWEGKTPCWEWRDCTRSLCEKCPAFLDRSRPCWETENTICDSVLGTDRSCEICKVYLTYNLSIGTKTEH